MSAEIPGDYPEEEENEEISEVDRLFDAFYELDEQIGSGERQGVEAVNEYIRLQAAIFRELARTKPADYLRYTRLAKSFERKLNEESYEGKARICQDEVDGYKGLMVKKNRERYDPTKPEDPNRDETIKKYRKAAANWLRAEAACLEDETPPENIPPQELV